MTEFTQGMIAGALGVVGILVLAGLLLWYCAVLLTEPPVPRYKREPSSRWAKKELIIAAVVIAVVCVNLSLYWIYSR